MLAITVDSYNCGQPFSLCRFTWMLFLPLLFQRRCLAHSPKKKSSQNRIPFSRSFNFQSAKQKADTQKHQKSAGVFLSLQNDVLCNGFEIQRRDCLFICSLADSTKKHRVQTAVFSLSIPQALGGLHRILNRNILYLVVTSFIGTLLYQTPRRKSSLWWGSV